MVRTVFSAALVMLLAVALAWGNCLNCADMIRVDTETHGCCDTDQVPTPEPKDCIGKTADFEKAVQPEKASPAPPAAEPIALSPVRDERLAVTAHDLELAVHTPSLITPLRI